MQLTDTLVYVCRTTQLNPLFVVTFVRYQLTYKVQTGRSMILNWMGGLVGTNPLRIIMTFLNFQKNSLVTMDLKYGGSSMNALRSMMIP